MSFVHMAAEREADGGCFPVVLGAALPGRGHIVASGKRCLSNAAEPRERRSGLVGLVLGQNKARREGGRRAEGHHWKRRRRRWR